MPHDTKKQHYVPQHYLKEWETAHKKIAVNHDGRVFSSNLINIAQENYFYRLRALSLDELIFVKEFLKKEWPDSINVNMAFVAQSILPVLLKELMENGTNQELFQMFSLIADFLPLNNMKEILRVIFSIQQKIEGIPTEHIQGMQSIVNTFGEGLSCCVEEDGFEYLLKLRNGKTDFFSDSDDCELFLLYIIYQLFRTPRYLMTMKDIPSKNNINFENVMTYLRWPIVTQIQSFLFEHRAEYSIILIKNDTAHEFITGDQPMVNLVFQKRPTFFDLFYPITPSKAMLLTKRPENYINITNITDEAVAKKLNTAICSCCIHQVYATDENFLKKNGYYAGMPCGDMQKS